MAPSPPPPTGTPLSILQGLITTAGEGVLFLASPDHAENCQDSSGTGSLAAAVSDPVGYLEDVNGVKAAVTNTGSARPLLAKDGDGAWYVDFNGSSQILFNAAPWTYAAGTVTAILVATVNAAIDKRPFGERSTSSTSPVYSPLQVHVTDAAKSSAFIRNDANVTTLFNNATILPSDAWTGTRNVFVAIDAGNAIGHIKNDSAGASTTSYTRSGTLTLNRFAIGGLVGGSISYTDIHVYGLFIVKGTLSAADLVAAYDAMKALTDPPPPPTGPTRWTIDSQLTTHERWKGRDIGSITESSGVVSAWVGKNATSLAQGTGAQRPSLSATGGGSGNPSIDFTASGGPDQLAATVAAYTGTQLTVFLVGKFGSASGNYARLFSGYNAAAAGDENNTSSFTIQRLGTNATVQVQRNGAQIGVATVTYDAWFIICLEFSGTQGRMSINGGTPGAWVNSSGAFNIDTWWMGYNITGAYQDVIVLPSLLSAEDRARANGDIAHDLSLTSVLPSDHTYKTDPPYLDEAPAETVIRAHAQSEPYYKAGNPVPASYAEPAGNQWARISLAVNGTVLGAAAYITADAATAPNTYQQVEWTVPVAKTAIETLSVVYDNDWGDPTWTGQPGTDRNAILRDLIVDPASPTTLLPSEGEFIRAVGATLTPAATKAFENGRWHWPSAGDRLGNVTSPPGPPSPPSPPGSPSSDWPPTGRADMSAYGWIAPPSYAVDEDTYFHYYLDSTAGTNGSGTKASPFNSWASALAVLGNGVKLGIKRGSSFNQLTSFANKAGFEIRAYGTGDRPKFYYSYFRTPAYYGVNSLGRTIYRCPQGALPEASHYKVSGDRVTGNLSAYPVRATIVLVDNPSPAYSTTLPAGWKYDAVNSINAIDKTFHFYHDVAGGYIYFTHPSSPSSVEVPREDHFFVSPTCNNAKFVGLHIASARDYGEISQSGCYNIEFAECLFAFCGMSAAYIQARNNVATTGMRFINCRWRFCHGSGPEFVWPGSGIRSWFTGLEVKWCDGQFVNMGPPYVYNLTNPSWSQDYYGAWLKFFQGYYPTSPWTFEIAYCYGSDIGTFVGGQDSRVVDGDQGHFYWHDTVTSGTGSRIHHCWMRNVRSAGVFLEDSPGTILRCDHLIVHATGLGKKYYPDYSTNQSDLGWVGGVCLGRGSNCPDVIVEYCTFVDNGYAAYNVQAGGGSTGTLAGGGTVRYNIFDCRDANGVAIRESPAQAGLWSNFSTNIIKPESYGEYKLLKPPANIWGTPAVYNTAAQYQTARGAGTFTGTLEQDPLLVDPANGNYTLQLSSPARGAGPSGVHLGAWDD